MEQPDVAEELRSRSEQLAHVVTQAGDSAVVRIFATDVEGLTSYQTDPGEDRSVAHWWPYVEIASVSDPE